MTTPDHLVTHSTDPYPVRPGTSAVLTARTIDATVRPPLVKAQEAVAAFVPRLADPRVPPLMIGTLGLTFALVLLATHRIRFRPSAALASALLLMLVSSFHPVQSAGETQVVDDAVSVDDAGSIEGGFSDRFDGQEIAPPAADWVPVPEEVAPDFEEHSPALPPDQIPTPPEVSEPAMPPIEIVMLEGIERLMSHRGDRWRDEEELVIIRHNLDRIRREMKKMRLQQLESSLRVYSER